MRRRDGKNQTAEVAYAGYITWKLWWAESSQDFLQDEVSPLRPKQEDRRWVKNIFVNSVNCQRSAEKASLTSQLKIPISSNCWPTDPAVVDGQFFCLELNSRIVWTGIL